MEWKIQTHGSKCSECDKEFEDKESYRTLLYDLDGELMRRDLCTVCYKKVEKTLFSSTDEWISSWSGKYKKPAPKPKEAIQKDMAESILMELVSEPEQFPALPGTIYILSAMLERKKLIKLRDSVQKKNKRIFVYEHAGTGHVFTVTDVQPNSDEWTLIHDQVNGLMEQGISFLTPQDTEEIIESTNNENRDIKVENIHPEEINKSELEESAQERAETKE